MVKKTFKQILDFIEVHFNAVVFMTLFLSMVIQVFMRYVLNRPSPILHELTSYTFVWTVYLSAALTRRFKGHIRFNILYDALPRKAQLIIDLIFDLFVSSLFVISFYPVVNALISYKFIESTVLGISWTYLFIVFPVFMILVLIHNIKFIYYEIRELITGEKAPEEEKPWV
jgi:TRAP-type C4-dicarboxylate transport system permease small subunit